MTKRIAPEYDTERDAKVLSQLDEARALGVAWALEIQAALRAEKRRAAGGWPGTMREASFRVRKLIGSVGLPGHPTFNLQQSEQLTRELYFSAKGTWSAHSEPEELDANVESQASY